jgi:gas vesicle protein
MSANDTLKSTEHTPARERGEFVTLGILAAAVGVGAALLLAPDAGSRARQRVGRGRREKRLIGLAGFLVGAGLTALLTPESGPATRKLLGGTLSRIKVGAVERIERLRQNDVSEPAESPVRSLQELGRESNDVF